METLTSYAPDYHYHLIVCVCVLLRTATGGERLSEVVLGIQLGNLVVVLGRRLAGGLRSFCLQSMCQFD